MATFDWPLDQARWADEVFRAFSPFLSTRPTRSAGVFPAVNLYDDGTSYLVRAEIPGMKKDDLEITVKGEQLTLRGERKLEPASPKASYHRRETESGQFRRVVTLPQAVDAERISASYVNGVLEVVLPRLPQAQPRKIEIH
jgi:HSP20 family protein